MKILKTAFIVSMVSVLLSSNVAADFIPFEVDSSSEGILGSFNYDSDGYGGGPDKPRDGTPRGYNDLYIFGANTWLQGLSWSQADNAWAMALKATNEDGDFLRLRFDAALTTIGLNESVAFEGLIRETNSAGVTIKSWFNGSVTNVSEPGTLALLVVGLAGLVAARRRSGVRV